METTFVPGEPSVADLVAAVKLLVADFDGRQTSRVTGTGGKVFEFYPTAITDNIPPLHPELSRAVCLLSRYHLKEVAAATVGVGEEDRGAMIISDLLLFHGLPRTLARWTPTGAPGEIKVPLANEYVQEGSINIYLNGITAADRVILIDDLISTGGTLVALVKAIREAGAQILEILTSGEKEENHGRRHLLEETDLSLKTMLVTTLVPSETGFRSKVAQVHLGDMPAWLAEKVAEHFPVGFCRSGSGEPCSE